MNEKISENKKEPNIDYEKSDILIKIAKEYFNAAEDEFNKSRYNSSVVLYFKSLVALVNLFILQKTKDFPFYQNSYFQIMSAELAEVIKDDAKIMVEKTKIEL